MTTLIFDIPSFRAQFPAFANTTIFPDIRLQGYWDWATSYIDPTGDYGWLQGASRQLALNMMTAHLTQLSVFIANGQTPGLVQSATIDKVTVSLTPPLFKNQWGWWLGLTAYGAELYALLQARSVGGFYAGGSNEIGAFRKAGGLF